jgi:hypothetical protein
MAQSAMPISNNPVDKLQAALNQDATDAGQSFPPDYLPACKRWFAALSTTERVAAAAAVAAYGLGQETAAMEIAAALPPAPKLPLRNA